jgi:hypothetical protein
MKNSAALRIASALALISFTTGCLFAPAIKSARSLPRGERSLRYTGAYWNVDTIRHSQAPTPTPTPYYYYSSSTPVHATTTAKFWDFALDGRMGTLLDGLDMGLTINLAGAVTGDLNYQFLGFNQTPKGLAASVGGQISALGSGGYGMAGDLTLTQRLGSVADISLGGRFGGISGNSSSSSSSYYSYDYTSNLYLDPSSYNYADIYLGAEIFFLDRASLSAGFAYRQILGGPFTNYNDYYGTPVTVSYPSTYYFTLSLRTYHGGKAAEAASKAKAAQRSKRRRRQRDLDDADAAAESPIMESPTAPPAPSGDQSLWEQMLREAKLEVSKGNFAAGLAKFKASEAFKAPDYNTLMNEGYCQYMLQNWPGALQDYQKALLIEPSNERLRGTVENLRKKTEAKLKSPGETP